MSKLYKPEEVVSLIVGDVEWHGETYADQESYENLDTLDVIMQKLAGALYDIKKSNASHPNNASAIMLNKKATSIINEVRNIFDEAVAFDESKSDTWSIGTKVKHTRVDNRIGIILGHRNDRQGYDWFVKFELGADEYYEDWYKEDVLEEI